MGFSHLVRHAHVQNANAIWTTTTKRMENVIENTVLLVLVEVMEADQHYGKCEMEGRWEIYNGANSMNQIPLLPRFLHRWV